MTADLDLLLSFLQSSHELDDPVGRAPERLAKWLVAAGLLPPGVEATADDVVRARHLRAALNSVLAQNAGQPADPRSAPAVAAVTRRAQAVLELQDDGSLASKPASSPVDGALATLVDILYRAQVTGELARLKSCRKCGFAFYDTSKNRSRIWCDMALCGSQQKARAYRQRKAVAGH